MNAEIRGLSLREIIDHRAEEAPDQIFLIDPDADKVVTYKSLQQSCRLVVSRMRENGYQSGEPVGYAMANGADAARVILGLLYGGFLATAINLVSGRSTIAHVLSHSEARFVFCQQDTKSLVEEAAEAGGPHLCVIGDDWFDGSGEAISGGDVSSQSDGLLMYTSGTTGLPKGVVLTQKSLVAGASNTVEAHQLTRNDRALCVLPLYHINGLCVTLLGALVSGSSLIMPRKFSASRFWSILRDNQGTWFSVVPTQISYLLNEARERGHDPSGLEKIRFGRSASAPLSPEVQEAFEAHFSVPIVETMGLTETAAQILSNPLHGPHKHGSPGIAYGNEVIIGDPQQKEMPRGEEGEILVRGDNVLRCYLKNEEATATAITDAGWLRTGDLGRMDDDGYVYVTGRLKELIIKGGENIAPREIDEALYSHPDVVEAAAFPRPCEIYGQRVEACVKLANGSPLGERELIALCEERLGKFKSPEHIHFMDELPKGPSGKIQRAKIAELTG